MPILNYTTTVVPAHLRSIEHRCEQPGCTKGATVQLHNTWNAPMGRYCKKHGEAALKECQARDVPSGP